MGFRFRRTITIFPGLRLNISKSGISFSVGPRGSSVSFGKRGAFANIGLPGTGVSYRTRLDKFRSDTSGLGNAYRKMMSVQYALSNDLLVLVLNKDGKGFPEVIEKSIRKERARDILTFLHQQRELKNRPLNVLNQLHLDTDQPVSIQSWSSYTPAYPKPKPVEPEYTPVSWQDNLMFWSESVSKRKLQQQLNGYMTLLKSWEDGKQLFDTTMQKLWPCCCKDKAATEELLKTVLCNVEWPLPVKVGFSLSKNMDAVWLSLKLPDSDQLPQYEYSVVESDQRLSRKSLSEDGRRKLYAQLAHAAGFRLLGKIFAIVPVPWVIVSVYSPCGHGAVGAGNIDQCIYSVQVQRHEWEGLEFSQLEELEIPEALNSFHLRRNMTQSAHFYPVAPFG